MKCRIALLVFLAVSAGCVGLPTDGAPTTGGTTDETAHSTTETTGVTPNAETTTRTTTAKQVNDERGGQLVANVVDQDPADAEVVGYDEANVSGGRITHAVEMAATDDEYNGSYAEPLPPGEAEDVADDLSSLPVNEDGGFAYYVRYGNETVRLVVRFDD
jgi:hypothetical protein